MSQDFTEQEIDILHLAEYIDENELEWNNSNKSKKFKIDIGYTHLFLEYFGYKSN